MIIHYYIAAFSLTDMSETAGMRTGKSNESVSIYFYNEINILKRTYDTGTVTS